MQRLPGKSLHVSSAISRMGCSLARLPIEKESSFILYIIKFSALELLEPNLLGYEEAA
jgi:hypothetical protein